MRKIAIAGKPTFGAIKALSYQNGPHSHNVRPCLQVEYEGKFWAWNGENYCPSVVKTQTLYMQDSINQLTKLPQ